MTTNTKREPDTDLVAAVPMRRTVARSMRPETLMLPDTSMRWSVPTFVSATLASQRLSAPTL